MWTDEQEIKIRNTLAREILSPNARDYELKVGPVKVLPKTLAEIEIRVKIADINNDRSIMQFSDVSITNILNKCGVTGYRLGSIFTTIFNDCIFFEVYVHFEK